MSESDLSPYQRWKKNIGDTRPWDILNPNTGYAEKVEADRRYDICNSCPEFIDLTKQCKKCGCVMSLKTKLQNASCPIGKW
jgi:hypothetical protein